jgi:hypothetical protein
MASNKNPNEKQPGEKAPGKYHYNPGNMSGKTAKNKDESEPQSEVDGKQNRAAPPRKR